METTDGTFEGHIRLSSVTGGPQQGRCVDRRYVTATALSARGAEAMEAMQPPSRGDHRGPGIMREFFRSELPLLAKALGETTPTTTASNVSAATAAR